MWRGGEVDSGEKKREKFGDIVIECSNDIYRWHDTCRQAEKKWK